MPLLKSAKLFLKYPADRQTNGTENTITLVQTAPVRTHTLCTVTTAKKKNTQLWRSTLPLCQSSLTARFLLFY